MMGTKITALTALTTYTSDDLLYVVDDPNGSPTSKKISCGNLFNTFLNQLNTFTATQTISKIAGQSEPLLNILSPNMLDNYRSYITFGDSSAAFKSFVISFNYHTNHALRFYNIVDFSVPIGNGGFFIFGDNNVGIYAGSKLFLDVLTGTGGDTYIMESSPNIIDFFVGGIDVFSLRADSPFIHLKEGITGAGTASLGANCPAVTTSAPYTWLKVRAPDDSVVYIPAWK